MISSEKTGDGLMKFVSDLLNNSFIKGALALAATISAFYITNVVESLRSNHTAIYYFERDRENETVLFHLINISRSKKIDAARFILMCKDQNDNCFGDLPGISPGTLVSQATTSPNFGREIDDRKSAPGRIDICLGLIPSSQTSVRVAPTGGSIVPLIALYDPWYQDCSLSKKEDSLLLLRKGDLHALVAQHYFTFVTIALLSSIALIIFVGVSLTRQKPEESK